MYILIKKIFVQHTEQSKIVEVKRLSESQPSGCSRENRKQRHRLFKSLRMSETEEDGGSLHINCDVVRNPSP